MLVAKSGQNEISKTQAEFRSARSEGYLSTLARHFGQKIEVSDIDGVVHLRFSCGLAMLSAANGTLRLRIEAPSKSQMLETCQVVESHLLRFAFREEPKPLVWVAL